MRNEQLSGSHKAAILLMAFGEDISTEVFKNLNEFEIKRISTAMSNIGRVDSDQVDYLIEEFYEILQENRKFFLGDADYTQKVINHALKGNEAKEIIQQLSLSSRGLSSLDVIDLRGLVSYISDEHPQTIAMILSHLKPDKFMAVLKMLSKPLRIEIIERVAKIEPISPEFIDEVESALRLEISASSAIGQEKVGGIEVLADMINMIDSGSEEVIFEELDDKHPELSEEIKELMFVFEDIAAFDMPNMQEVIKAVPGDKWRYALKSASQELQDSVFSNMSVRAADMLKDDISNLGAIKLTEVEKAQGDILMIVKGLQNEGKISLSSESEYV